MKWLKLSLLAMTLLLGGMGRARADAILPDSGRGWISDSSGDNGNSSINNYFAGNLGPLYRNHFDFSIPTLTGILTGATLTLDNSSSFGAHSGGAHTYDVSSLGTFGSYGFSGIGTGTPYGSVGISADGVVTIALNAAALADIVAAQGGTFSVGGVNSAEGFSFEYDFGFSGSGFSTTLTLEGVTVPRSVPEPTSLALLGLGAVGLIGYGWRRRKQAATSFAG